MCLSLYITTADGLIGEKGLGITFGKKGKEVRHRAPPRTKAVISCIVDSLLYET